jgi:hypothetical protein
MPRIKVNLADVGERGGNVEPGKWESELTDIEETKSSKDNDMLVWSWEIKEGPSEGEIIKSWTSLLENALFNLKEHLVAFGADPEAEVDIEGDKLMGRRATLVVGTRKFKDRDSGEDRETSSVIKVLPLSKSKSKSAPPPKRSAAGSKASSSKASRKPIEDDELPF